MLCRGWFPFIMFSEQHSIDSVCGLVGPPCSRGGGHRPSVTLWRGLDILMCCFKPAVLSEALWGHERARPSAGNLSWLSIGPKSGRQSLTSLLLKTVCEKLCMITNLGGQRKNKIIGHFRHDEKGSWSLCSVCTCLWGIQF